MLEPIHLIFGSSIAIAGFFLFSSHRVIRRQRGEKERETRRIRDLQCKINAALQDDAHDASREAFSTTLKTASLTTDLQAPRLLHLAKIDTHPPEKYKILGKLASQGMDAEEIAAILGISRVEAGQLLSLSSMAKCSR